VSFRIYLISDGSEPDRIARALDELPPGAAAVQLRDKAASGRELSARASRLREMLRDRAPLLVNDRADVALAFADGVHLPSHGLPVARARALVGDRLIGASTHSLDEARAAEAAGADFVTLGPIWPTRSHPGARPLGVEELAKAVAALRVPVFALGGLDADRALEAFSVGARAATLGNLLGAGDVASAARAFAAALTSSSF